jgi:hypothetical protein
VYGTIGFTDKLSSGVVIAIVQVLNPRSNGDRYLKHVTRMFDLLY